MDAGTSRLIPCVQLGRVVNRVTLLLIGLASFYLSYLPGWISQRYPRSLRGKCPFHQPGRQLGHQAYVSSPFSSISTSFCHFQMGRAVLERFKLTCLVLTCPSCAAVNVLENKMEEEVVEARSVKVAVQDQESHRQSLLPPISPVSDRLTWLTICPATYSSSRIGCDSAKCLVLHRSSRRGCRDGEGGVRSAQEGR
jgi:hypothetical protein